MTIILDGAKMTTRAEAHEHIAEALKLPDHYGKNLDALHDCLSEIKADVELYNTECLFTYPDFYGEYILDTFKDAEMENPNFKFDYFTGGVPMKRANDLRSDIDMLRDIPGQLIETDIEADPHA